MHSQWGCSKIDVQPALDLSVQVTLERTRLPFCDDFAEAEYINIVSHFHDPANVVVNEQDGHTLGSEQFDPPVHLLGDFRRQPNAWLVDQAQSRSLEIRLSELHHLLLTARQVASLGMTALTQ